MCPKPVKVRGYLVKLQLALLKSMLKLSQSGPTNEVVVAIAKKSEPTCQRSNETSDHLSDQEETILRLRKDIKPEADIPLKRKSNNPMILARLEQLEREIIEKARGIIN